jgi:hypothetical protein
MSSTQQRSKGDKMLTWESKTVDGVKVQTASYARPVKEGSLGYMVRQPSTIEITLMCSGPRQWEGRAYEYVRGELVSSWFLGVGDLRSMKQSIKQQLTP